MRNASTHSLYLFSPGLKADKKLRQEKFPRSVRQEITHIPSSFPLLFIGMQSIHSYSCSCTGKVQVSSSHRHVFYLNFIQENMRKLSHSLTPSQSRGLDCVVRWFSSHRFLLSITHLDTFSREKRCSFDTQVQQRD